LHILKKFSNIFNAVIVAIVISFGVQLYSGIEVETNILKLLPKTEQDQIIEDSVEKFINQFSQKVLFLVKHKQEKKAEEGAYEFFKRLKEENIFKTLKLKIDSDELKSYYKFYFPYRFQLLGGGERELFSNEKNIEKFLSVHMQKLYSPMALTNSAILESDPFFLFISFLQDLPQPANLLNLNNGLLKANVNDYHYVLLSADIGVDPFSSKSVQIVEAIDKAKKETAGKISEIEFVSTGMVFHADMGAKLAKREISVIGFGSILGIILLFMATFRSLFPLFLGMAPIVVGMFSAFVLGNLVFEKMHMLTLVFSASLIGISIDYSFHYFSDQLLEKKNWNAEKGLKNIFSGITLGLLTTVIGYFGLFFAPFPGLIQMAFFSSVGLIAAYLTVVFWFPVFVKKTSNHKEPFFLSRLETYFSIWRLKKFSEVRVLLFVLIPIIFVIGFTNLNVQDDIRSLRPEIDFFTEQENEFKQIAGRIENSHFLIVKGKNEEQAIQSEEEIAPELEKLIESKDLAGYQAVSKAVPSIKRQKQNFSLLSNFFNKNKSRIKEYMNDLGFSKKSFDYLKTISTKKNIEYLTTEKWVSDLPQHFLQNLQIEKSNQAFTSVILLENLKNSEILSTIVKKHSNITYVNKVSQISNLMKKYRKMAGILVCISYICIFLFLMVRYGFIKSFLIMTPPVMAALLTIGLLGTFSIDFNLFNTLALLLILGIGIDYTLFLEEAKEQKRATMLAIFLSALTTLLSFGLLALSKTPALSSFGLTILMGISFAFLLSPFSVAKIKKQKKVS